MLRCRGGGGDAAELKMWGGVAEVEIGGDEV